MELLFNVKVRIISETHGACAGKCRMCEAAAEVFERVTLAQDDSVHGGGETEMFREKGAEGRENAGIWCAVCWKGTLSVTPCHCRLVEVEKAI